MAVDADKPLLAEYDAEAGAPEHSGEKDGSFHVPHLPDNDHEALPSSLYGSEPDAALLRAESERMSEPEPPPEPTTPANAKDRLHSVDVARGLTVALMIYVNNADDGRPWWQPHAAWNGLHLADTVMPAFLVIVGVSVVLSLARPRRTPRWRLILKVLSRAAALFALGVFLQGGVPGHFATFDLYSVRIMGVLQRIALAYLIAALVVLAFPPKAGGPAEGTAPWWIAGLAIFVTYICTSLLLRVPGCRDVRPALAPDCNVASWLDSRVLKPQHMYQNPTCKEAVPPCPLLDPEGLFATAGAVCSAFVGVLYGFLLLQDGRSQRSRVGAVAVAAAVMLACGGILVAAKVPINKNIYSSSYILITGGIAGFMLVVTSLLDFVSQFAMVRALTAPFIWLGTNSLAVFAGDILLQHAMENCFYWREPSQSARAGLHDLLRSSLRRIGLREGEAGANNIYAGLDALFWVIIAAVMYRKRIFWKI